MANAPAAEPATADDVKRVLGDLDGTTLLDIMTLRPTVLDLEEASTWLAGDPDVFGAGQPLQPAAGEIVAILTANQDEEPEPDKALQNVPAASLSNGRPS